MLGGIGQDHDPVGANVHEATEYGQHFLDAALLHLELARAERREERGVVRQDPDVPLARRRDHHVDVILVDGPLRRDHLEVQRH